METLLETSVIEVTGLVRGANRELGPDIEAGGEQDDQSDGGQVSALNSLHFMLRDIAEAPVGRHGSTFFDRIARGHTQPFLAARIVEGMAVAGATSDEFSR